MRQMDELFLASNSFAKSTHKLCTLLRLPAPQAVVGPPPPPPSQGGFVRHANTVVALPAACAVAKRADRAPWPAGRRCREEPWRCRACFGLRAAAVECHVRSQVVEHALLNRRGCWVAGWRMPPPPCSAPKQNRHATMSNAHLAARATPSTPGTGAGTSERRLATPLRHPASAFGCIAAPCQ